MAIHANCTSDFREYRVDGIIRIYPDGPEIEEIKDKMKEYSSLYNDIVGPTRHEEIPNDIKSWFDKKISEDDFNKLKDSDKKLIAEHLEYVKIYIAIEYITFLDKILIDQKQVRRRKKPLKIIWN
jgi:hypothetical protein